MAERTVALDGDAVHLADTGGDGPAVLFSAGLGESWLAWRPVLPLLPDDRLVCFDRPGLGGSPLSDRPPTLRAEADRFAALADLVAPGRPVRVVAHSAAALHAEAFARRWPNRVAGLVLVDPSVEPDAVPRPGAGQAAVRALLRRLPGAVAPLAASRLPALLGPPAYRLGFRGQNAGRRTPDSRAAAAYGEAETAVAALAELLAYRDQAVDLRLIRARHPFPPVPVVVLTALGGLSPAAARRAEATGAGLTALLGGEQVTLPDARHLVMVDRPDAVADAVRAVSA